MTGFEMRLGLTPTELTTSYKASSVTKGLSLRSKDSGCPIPPVETSRRGRGRRVSERKRRRTRRYGDGMKGSRYVLVNPSRTSLDRARTGSTCDDDFDHFDG